MTTPVTPSRLAIHEAAHAVAHLAVGHDVIGEVTIIQNPGAGFTGCARVWIPPRYIPMFGDTEGTVTPEDVARMTAVLIAAEVAEMINFGEADEQGVSADRSQIEAIASRCAPDDVRGVIRRAYCYAGGIIHHNMPSVLCLAAALDQRGTLTGSEVKALLAAAGLPVEEIPLDLAELQTLVEAA